MLFPENKNDFFNFCENFSKNLEQDSNGQIRRKASWLGARMAKSLPNQKPDFNINTLLDAFNQADQATETTLPLDEAYTKSIEKHASWMVRVLEQMRELLDEHKDKVKVEYCYDFSVHQVFGRKEDIKECDFDEGDTDRCYDFISEHKKETDAIATGIAELKEQGVTMPQFSPQSQEHDYLVTYHLEGNEPSNVIVSATSDDADHIYNLVEKQLLIDLADVFDDESDEHVELYIDHIIELGSVRRISV